MMQSTKNRFKIITLFMILIAWSNALTAYTWSQEQQVDVDGSGNIVAVWQSIDFSSGRYLIQSSYYSVGIGWSTPVTLSSTTSDAYSPLLAVNTTGDAVAMWFIDDLQGNVAIETAMLPFGGSWSTPTQISTVTQIISQNSAIKINDNGDIVATWNILADDISVVRVATATIGGTWSEPVTISQ